MQLMGLFAKDACVLEGKYIDLLPFCLLIYLSFLFCPEFFFTALLNRVGRLLLM